MRIIPALLLAGIVYAGEGQGPVSPGPIAVEGLRLGTFWTGKAISHNDLVGKVVLVEIWGS